MKPKISFRALTMTLLVALVVSYVLCIVGALLFGWMAPQTWGVILPGFTWPLTLGSFLIGLVWIVVYSIYAAALIAFPYNYFVGRESPA